MHRRALLAAAGLTAATPASASGGGEGSTESYVFLRGLSASAPSRDGRRGVMSVELGVDVADADLRERAVQGEPRLRSACNEVVQRAAARLLPGAPPDVDRLARDLQTAIDATLGRRGAQVLLGTVMVF